MADMAGVHLAGIEEDATLSPEIGTGGSLPLFAPADRDPGLDRQQDFHRPIQDQLHHQKKDQEQIQDARQYALDPLEHLSAHQQSQERQQDCASIECMRFGMETVSNPEMSTGQSTPSLDAPDSMVENVSELSQVSQLEHLDHEKEKQQTPQHGFQTPARNSLPLSHIYANDVVTVFENIALHKQHHPVFQQHQQELNWIFVRKKELQMIHDTAKQMSTAPPTLLSALEQIQPQHLQSEVLESVRMGMKTRLSPQDESEQQHPCEDFACAGTELMIGSNVGILTDFLPYTGTSPSVVENKFEHSEPDRRQPQQQSPQQEQHVTDAPQDGCSSAEQLYSPGESQQQQPNTGCLDRLEHEMNEAQKQYHPIVEDQLIHANEDAAARGDGTVSHERLGNSEPLSPKLESSVEGSVSHRQPAVGSTTVADASVGRKTKNLNPFAEEFVPFTRAESSSVRLSKASSSKTSRENVGNNQKKQQADFRRHWDQDKHCRRTIYLSHIPNHFTEEQVAALFIRVGQVVDCRVWGDLKFQSLFGYVEFTEENAAREAVKLSGSMVNCHDTETPIRIVASKIAIIPVDQGLLPQTEDEMERCGHTIYCKNIDGKLSAADVRQLFECLCGEIVGLTLIKANHRSSIAFVEFETGESAIKALSCTGAMFGSQPIRVTPSKTVVKPHFRRLHHN